MSDRNNSLNPVDLFNCLWRLLCSSEFWNIRTLGFHSSLARCSMKYFTIVMYGAVAQFAVSRQCKVVSWVFVLPGLSSIRWQLKRIIYHVPLRRRLGCREVALMLGHAGGIHRDPAPSCGSWAARTPQEECGDTDTASTGRDLIPCPVFFICSHCSVNFGPCSRFYTLKQNRFLSLPLLASLCLCIRHGSRPGTPSLFSWACLKLSSFMARNNPPLEKNEMQAAG